MKQTVQLDMILATVEEVTGVSEREMSDRIKSLRINTARGVYFLVARQYGFHPFDVAKRLNRSRASCIITTKQYRWYYQCGDKSVVELVDKIRDIINNSNNI